MNVTRDNGHVLTGIDYHSYVIGETVVTFKSVCT